MDVNIIGSLGGEGKRIIEEAECGLVAEPNNSLLLAQKILEYTNVNLSRNYN